MSTSSTIGSPANDLLSPSIPPVAKTISERLSQEIIIALVGPIGSGVSTTADFIRDILASDFAYKVCPVIKPSDIIKAEAHRVGKPVPKRDALDQYIESMQDIGNELRRQFGGDYLSKKIVERIYKFRAENGGINEKGIHIPGRRAYIIDSVKNLEELELLRQVYGESLCIFGVFAPDAKRKARLTDSGVAEAAAQRLMDRDQAEVATFGQKTRKIFVQADLFLRNDKKKDELRVRVDRFINLIFDTAIHTPTKSEAAMYEASAASANSACMSRQVGASILSSRGELIAVGWNDVPRFGGGLYGEDDQSVFDEKEKAIVDRDRRCFKWGGCICHNEVRRNHIIENISTRIATSSLVKKGTAAIDIRKLLSGTEVDSIIEYSRSIHAEMEAILSVAREGKHSLVGASLYTNTYPCHNCARHIVAAGIYKVYYIEPYLKSLAIELHNDAVTEDSDEEGKVVFQQYDGVAPKNYLRLFRPSADRKQAGRLSRPSKKLALPTFRVALDSQADYEAKVIADLSEAEQTGAS